MLRECFRIWGDLGKEIAASQTHASACGFVVLPGARSLKSDGVPEASRPKA